jgi:hypothetical protein
MIEIVPKALFQKEMRVTLSTGSTGYMITTDHS